MHNQADAVQETSEWTLDYPPLFAWFEWALSHPAALFDARMLDVHALNWHSAPTRLYLRLSVIASETVLYVAVWLYLFIPSILAAWETLIWHRFVGTYQGKVIW